MSKKKGGGRKNYVAEITNLEVTEFQVPSINVKLVN